MQGLPNVLVLTAAPCTCIISSIENIITKTRMLRPQRTSSNLYCNLLWCTTKEKGVKVCVHPFVVTQDQTCYCMFSIIGASPSSLRVYQKERSLLVVDVTWHSKFEHKATKMFKLSFFIVIIFAGLCFGKNTSFYHCCKKIFPFRWFRLELTGFVRCLFYIIHLQVS